MCLLAVLGWSIDAGSGQLLRPAQTWPTQTRQNGDNQEKEGGEECSLGWQARLAMLAMWPEPGEIHPSLPSPPPAVASPHPGASPPHHDQPPTPILNPQPTQI